MRWLNAVHTGIRTVVASSTLTRASQPGSSPLANYVDHVHNRKQHHLFLSPLVCLFVFLIKFAATLTNIITYGKKDFQKTSILLLPDSFQKKLPFSDYDLARVLLADLSITCSRNKKNYVHHVLCNMLMSCN